MTDLRARRTAVITAAARAEYEAKAHAADQAIRRLVKRGEPVTFQAVQREAGVSHAFLYVNPGPRDRIERLRARSRPQPAPVSDTSSDNTITQVLTSQVGHLNKQNRDQTQALRAALEQAHGENLQLRRELTRLGPAPCDCGSGKITGYGEVLAPSAPQSSAAGTGVRDRRCPDLWGLDPRRSDRASRRRLGHLDPVADELPDGVFRLDGRTTATRG